MLVGESAHCARSVRARGPKARSGFAAVLALLALLLCGACAATPTLPLPPPVATVGFPEDGFAEVEGQVHALAYVSVLNEQNEAGVITRADGQGHFKTRIEAKSGDLLTIWQDLGDGEPSEHKQLIVPEER